MACLVVAVLDLVSTLIVPTDPFVLKEFECNKQKYNIEVIALV